MSCCESPDAAVEEVVEDSKQHPPDGAASDTCWVMRRCTAQQTFQRFVEQGFYKMGLLIGKRPRSVLVASLLIGFGLCSLILLADFETRIEYLYVPRAAPSFKDFNMAEELFGKRPRRDSAVLYAQDGGSMLRKEHLEWAWGAYAALLYVRSTNGQVGYADICERHPLTKNCTVTSLFSFFPGANISEGGSLHSLGKLPDFQNADVTLRTLREKNLPGIASVLSADSKALRFVFPVAEADIVDRGLLAESSKSLERILEWEDTFLDELARQRDNGLGMVKGMAISSVDGEVARNMTGAIPFLMGGINLIFVFLALMLGGRPCTRSRLLLSLGAVCVIQLAEVIGFAVTAACQVPLTDMSLLLVFLAVGVGVDDIIVLTDAFDEVDLALPQHERLAKAFQHAGKAILITSVTNLTAFLVASTGDFPAVRWFCVAAGWVVFSLFVCSLTIYAPLLVLDERRRFAGRADCCLCCLSARPATAPSLNSPRSKSVIQRRLFRTSLKRIVSSLTSKPLPAAACMAILLGIAAAGVWCVSNPEIYTVGLPISGAFPDGSYLTEFLDETMPTYFGGMMDQLQIVVRDVGFEDAGIQDQLLHLHRTFMHIPQAVGNVTFFLLPMQEWEMCTQEGLAARNMDFGGKVKRFFASPGFAKCSKAAWGVPDFINPLEYGDDVSWNSDGSTLKAIQMELAVAFSTTVQGRIDAMKDIRKIFENQGLPGFVFCYTFLFADRDLKLWELIGSTLIYAGVSVVAVVSVFVHPLGAALIALCICTVDFSLLGLMALWDVPIDALSFVCLAMASGMSIDYVVHLAHSSIS